MKYKALIMILAVLVLVPLSVVAEEEINYTYFDTLYIDNGMDDSITAFDGRERLDVNIGDGSGLGLEASLALNPNVHVFAAYGGSNMDLNATYSIPYPSLDELQAAFYSRPESENWDAFCDLNDDGMVNAIDMGLMKAAGTDLRVMDSAAVDGDMDDWQLGIGYNRMLTSTISGYSRIFWASRDLDFANTTFMGEDADLSRNENGFGATVGARGKVSDRLELRGHVTYTPVGEVDLLAENDADRIRGDTLAGLGAQLWMTDALSFSVGVEGDGDVQSWRLGARYAMGTNN